jgi:hypothetical protein
MKVKAKHNFNHNGVYHFGGEVFDVEDTSEIEDYVEPLRYVSSVFPPDETPKRRGRPRKTQE